MLSNRAFHNKRMLAAIGEALLNIGTIEFQLGTGIPRLQSYFGMSVSPCYQKPWIPSLSQHKEPCLKLRDKLRGLVREDVETFVNLLETTSFDDDNSIRAMFEFVELADNTEIIYLELDTILGLTDGLRDTRNDLMHSTKLEFEEGLIVTTATESARVIPFKELVIFLRKSRHALHFSSSLMVSGVAMTAEGGKLYSTFSNGSHNSRFLKRLYRDKINDLGSRWRDHLTSS